MHVRSLLILFVAACGDSSGAGQPDAAPLPEDAVPRQVVMESKMLVAGQIAEATLDGGPGDTAVISLVAASPTLDWNLHGHANGSSQTIAEELGVMTASYTFAPTAQADWSLLLRNRGTAPMTVDVTIELHGDMQWSGWQ